MMAKMLQNANRIAWIDNARCIGIFLVFCGHLMVDFSEHGINSATMQHKFIYSFHIPLFFVLSGMVSKVQTVSFFVYLKKRLLRLYVPFIFFNILVMALWLAKNFFYSGHKHGELLDAVISRNISMLLYAKPAWNAVTWFLICLLLLDIWDYFFRKLMKSRSLLLPVMFLTIILAAIACSMKYNPETCLFIRKNSWMVASFFPALFFFQCGIFLRSYRIIESVRGMPQLLCLVFIFLVITLLTYDLNNARGIDNFSVNFQVASFGNLILFLITGLSGALCVIFASKLIGQKKILTIVSGYTLPLFCMNGMQLNSFNHIISHIFLRLPGIDNCILLTLACIVYTLAAILSCVPFIWFLNKYMPWSIGMLLYYDN